MRIAQSRDQKIKMLVHGVQAGFIFLEGCLTLSVMTKSGGIGRAVGYTFGLCFLSVPALIYQVMVPMWTRAWRFANVYAYVFIDVLFSIFWLASFASIAAWNATGLSKDKSSSSNSPIKSSDGTCSYFAYGSPSKCEVSRAAVGFGVIICLLFIATTALGMKGVFEYRRTGIMPNGNVRVHGQGQWYGGEDQDKDTWNTNIDEHDPTRPSDVESRHENGESFHHHQTGYGQVPQADEEIHEQFDPHPGRPLSYGSTSSLSVAPPAYDPTAAPSALSPNVYEDTSGGRVHFPVGNYSEAFR
ncbi:hypothetical protein M433DRAFT_163443 [Acidomyces richmondensis BFW]|nr:MAG: hypothetical protein FE78DRAFT_137128 [Acidomyces sp. 'richmondensis']KYG48483.1 hypothetical protein M433DRAFT_163443 [Acidomyces richmondensis BFW]